MADVFDKTNFVKRKKGKKEKEGRKQRISILNSCNWYVWQNYFAKKKRKEERNGNRNRIKEKII